jgi:hypothetical protein
MFLQIVHIWETAALYDSIKMFINMQHIPKLSNINTGVSKGLTSDTAVRNKFK